MQRQPLKETIWYRQHLKKLNEETMIPKLDKGEDYKYLRINERQHVIIKEKVRKECLTRVRVIDWLILKARQSVWSYFMPRS